MSKRKVILNNDGGSLLPAWLEAPISLPTFLDETINWLKGTPVDTLFWCVSSGVSGSQTSNAQSLSIGLDVKKWLHEKLLNIVTVSAMDIKTELTIEKELIETVHKSNCQFLSCFSLIPWWRSRISSNFWNGNPLAFAKDVIPSIEMIRAKCINIWESGVDGIYLFNFANMRHNHGSDPDNLLPKVITEVSDVNLLAQKNKHYIVYQRQETPRAIFEPRPLLPITLNNSSEEKTSIKFMIGDNIQKAIDKNLLSRTILKVNIMHLTNRDKVTFKLNGKAIKETRVIPNPWRWYWSQNECWLEFEDIAPPLRQGENDLEVTVEGRNSEVNASLVLTDVEVIVNYKK